MRIAVVTRLRSHVGGIETYVDLSSSALVARGHLVESFTEEDGGSRLTAALERWRPEVVLSHGLGNPADEMTIASRWPTVFFAHVYHGTCVGAAKTLTFPSPTPCTRSLGVGCLVAYYPRRCGGWNPVTMLRQFDVQRARLRAIRSCRAVATLSRHIADEYVRHGVPPAQVQVMPPVVRDLGPATPGAVPRTPHIVYVGRMEHLKGPSVLLEAVALAAPRLGGVVDLTFAGDGSARETVKRRAAALSRTSSGIRTSFCGKVPPGDIRRLFETASLLAVPSLWPEPFGLIGLEAASCGVPAVAFPIGGIPEWLKDGVNGRLADRHASAASLADAIVDCLGREDRYLKLRDGARAEASRARPETHAARLEAVLVEAARSGARVTVGAPEAD